MQPLNWVWVAEDDLFLFIYFTASTMTRIAWDCLCKDSEDIQWNNHQPFPYTFSLAEAELPICICRWNYIPSNAFYHHNQQCTTILFACWDFVYVYQGIGHYEFKRNRNTNTHNSCLRVLIGTFKVADTCEWYQLLF